VILQITANRSQPATVEVATKNRKAGGGRSYLNCSRLTGQRRPPSRLTASLVQLHVCRWDRWHDLQVTSPSLAMHSAGSSAVPNTRSGRIGHELALVHCSPTPK